MRVLSLGSMIAAIGVGVSAYAGTGVGSITVTQNQVTASIELPGGIQTDLSLTFEQALGLTADSIGISAKLVDPSDINLTSRLPGSVSVPAAFPVDISIEPPSTGPLAFSGIVSIDLHTHDLNYVAGTPLRLFAAEGGKSFQDITASVGLGSYRTGANKGGFSEFLIVADVRPIDTVITEKFKRLQGKLNDNASAIPAALLSTLQSKLTDARNTWVSGDPVGAADKVQQFADTVKQNSGTSIPDVWRSARDVVNVAGDLRGTASTLKFSLLVKAGGS